MKKLDKLKELLLDSTISTHPGEVLIQTKDRIELFDLLMQIAEDEE